VLTTQEWLNARARIAVNNETHRIVLVVFTRIGPVPKMNFESLSTPQLELYHTALSTFFGVRFVDDVQRYLDKIQYFLYRRLLKKAPPSLLELRPCCFKNIIFLPYKIGSASITKQRQVLVGAHEVAHAVRLRSYPESTAHWYGQYFVNDRFRALEESSAQETELDIFFWVTGKMRELSLSRYYCSASAIQVATTAYNMRKAELERQGRGATFDPVSQKAVSILRDYITNGGA